MHKPMLASDYDTKLTGTSFSVLLEVMTILKSYQDALWPWTRRWWMKNGMRP